MKAILNYHNNPKLSDVIQVKEGDVVFGRSHEEECHITKGRAYEVLQVNAQDMITVKNDIGVTDIYSVEYFINHN